jgi:uncharacterized delta-60 repeat protein
MKLCKNLPIYLLVIVCALLSIACSNGKSPVTPSSDEISGMTNALPETSVNPPENRDVVAVYDVTIDPDAGTFTITPGMREVAYHFPLTQMFPNVLKITGYGFTPNLWADIKLTHPYPGSIYDGFDARVIAILPARGGVYFYYPTLGVYANNAVVLEPDGYTKLFDSLGGSIVGNANPFKAYFKNQPYRRWATIGTFEETQRWQMNLAGFGGSFQFKLVVDVSTNYPTPPQSVVDNAKEPVQITSAVEPGLTDLGGSAEINVTLLDWQGTSGVGGVKVEAPDLFDGTIDLVYPTPGPNPNEYVYKNTIANEKFASAGEHKYLVATWDEMTGIYMYNEFKVNISQGPGKLIWAKRAGGTSDEEKGCAITTLSDNSTVITGAFQGTATFGQGEPNQTVLTSAGNADIFVARYNHDGTLAWAKRAGGSDNEYGRGITALSDNSTVVTGYFYGSATFGEDPGIVLTSAGSIDIFIARYNPNGTLAWAKKAGGTSFEEGYGITSLSDDSTVVAGAFQGSATFGPGESNPKVLTSSGGYDIFIARFNPDGTLAWAKKAGGTNQWDESYGISALSDSSTVITGNFEGSATFGKSETNQTILTSAGGYDIFIARYNPDGTLAWAKRAGGVSGDYGFGISTLFDNSTAVSGSFNGTATFGLGDPNETVLTSIGGSDFYIARYNSDGTLAWAKSAGGTSLEEGHAITTLSDSATVVTGFFTGSCTFGSGEINQTILTSYGSWDVFIAWYNTDGTLAWAKNAGGEDSDKGLGITALSDDLTVLTGYFNGTATFGSGEPNEIILYSPGGSDIFVAQYDSM